MTHCVAVEAMPTGAPLIDDRIVVKTNLLGLSIVDLEAMVVELGFPKFRARQIWRWVWRHGLSNFDEMSDIGKPARAQLAVKFCLFSSVPHFSTGAAPWT